MSSSLDPFEIFYLRRTLWSVAAEYRRLLFDHAGLRLAEWLQGGSAKIIKKGAGRAIYHVRHPHGEFYVKHFRPSTRFRSFHQRFRRDRAEKEFEVAQMMRSQGIPTVRPLALGERRSLGILAESFLVTEANPNHQTLYELIEQHAQGRRPIPPADRQAIARELARLTALLHARGLEHRDLHERNIVVEQVTDAKMGESRFHLRILDLHELRQHRELDWTKTLHELARLGRYFSIRSSRSDRLRFLRQYAAERAWSPPKTADRARQVEAEVILSRANFWRRRDLRPLGRGFWVQQDDDTGAIWSNGMDPSEIRSFLQDPARWLTTHARHWWKQGRATQVAEANLPANGREDKVVVKRYVYRPIREFIAALARDNPATRAYRNGLSLRLRELPTPRPLLLFHRRQFGLIHESYLITESVQGGAPIDRYLEHRCQELAPGPRGQFTRAFVRQVGRLIRQMHDRGVTHPDLKANNLLVTEGEDRQPRLFLIDLDGVQTWQRVPDRAMIQNLARFAVGFRAHPYITQTDRVRFLRAYLGAHRFQQSWKEIWRMLTRWADRKIEQNRRRGRFLA
jgi:tRNA A-37 threonylcarbamoyl transferase component Bud32